MSGIGESTQQDREGMAAVERSVDGRGGANILVIGVGNEARGDDMLGLCVAREISKQMLGQVTVVEKDGEGGGLMEAWRDRQSVILVDAFSSGATPGMVHCLDASISKIRPQLFRLSSHSFGVAEAIEISRRLNRLPHVLLIYGIEGRSFRIGAELSLPVRRRIPDLIEAITFKVHDLMHHSHHSPSSL